MILNFFYREPYNGRRSADIDTSDLQASKKTLKKKHAGPPGKQRWENTLGKKTIAELYKSKHHSGRERGRILNPSFSGKN